MNIDFLKASVLNEISILRRLNHQNIVKLYQVFETENSLYMVMEFVEGITLEDILSKSIKYDEIRFKNILLKIFSTLDYLSIKKIVHRDLKPENILVDSNDNIKIVDFGLASSVEAKQYIFLKCGTPGYIAPEIFKYDPKIPKTHNVDKCDIFAVGCIFHYM